jgi:hypothetical protein
VTKHIQPVICCKICYEAPCKEIYEKQLKTPYQRVLGHPDVPDGLKDILRQTKSDLDIVELQVVRF